jgi:hypothetical protein
MGKTSAIRQAASMKKRERQAPLALTELIGTVPHTTKATSASISHKMLRSSSIVTTLCMVRWGYVPNPAIATPSKHVTAVSFLHAGSPRTGRGQQNPEAFSSSYFTETDDIVASLEPEAFVATLSSQISRQ